MNKKQTSISGFTLVELLVVLAIMSMLMGIAGPNFKGLINSTSLTTGANAMVSALQRARSEAVKQGKQAGIAPTNWPTGTNWQTGWYVWVGTATTANSIQTYNGMTKDTTITMTNFTNSVPTYLADGRINGIGGSFKFAQGNEQRTVTIANTGRIRATNP